MQHWISLIGSLGSLKSGRWHILKTVDQSEFLRKLVLRLLVICLIETAYYFEGHVQPNQHDR
ncbi:hypothetical protein AJ87_49480 [Rhizobium yanglingense]|nr:hypothetical protein AJ87_42615 [Rhizobium yanglingense]OWK25891.1 hypothetical protein AJ87_49480 [Rhizobium yanglingense]